MESSKKRAEALKALADNQKWLDGEKPRVKAPPNSERDSS